MPHIGVLGRPHGGTPTNYIIRFVWRISRGRSGTPVKCSTHFAIFRVICAVCSYIWDVEVADCRWQSFCDLTESADESRPRPPVKCSAHFAIFRVICAVCSYIRDVEVADCRWQSFCDLTESADESRPLQKIMTYAMFCCRGGRPRPPVKCSTHFAIFRKIKIFTQNHHQASYPKYAPRGRNNPSCSRAHNY